MNTQAHILLNSLVLRKKERSVAGWPVFWGAVAPDLPMLVFYFVERVLRGMPESRVWNELYFAPHWQNFIDIFNSVPILLGLLAVGVLLKKAWLWLFSASGLLHVLCDFFVHREDAHRHFYPLSHYKFESSISYWDPAHGGLWFSTGEFLFFLMGSIWLWPQTESRWAKGGLILGNTLYGVTYAYFYFLSA